MAVSIYPVLCVSLALSLFHVVLSQNYQRQGGHGGFNAPLQRGTRQQSLLSGGGGQLSPQGMSGPGQRSGMMSPYSPSVAISSADSVLSHRSLGPSGRPLHAMAGGPPPMDRSQGSFSHVQDMTGGNAMQGSPNPWNQPEVHSPGFIQSRGPLVASPMGGARIDTFQQGQPMQPLNKMDALMINPSQAPTAATQQKRREPLVPGYIAQSNAPLNQKPANQWPTKAPHVTPGAQGPTWTQGINQPLSTFPQSILIDTEPHNALLASSKPGYQPEVPIVSVKQKTFANKNKEAPLADVNTGLNTFAGEQQPLDGKFAHQTDVKMMKNVKSVMADYSIIKDAGPMGPLLPGSPAPPTEMRQMYKSTPTDVRLQTGSPQYAGITDIVYQATNTPVLTGVPSTGFTNAWTTVVTRPPPEVTMTTTVPTTTTTAEPTTTNVYTRLSVIVNQEKMKKEKAKELAELRRALQDLGIANASGLYQKLVKLSAAARKNILKRATLIKTQKKKRSKTNRRSG